MTIYFKTCVKSLEKGACVDRVSTVHPSHVSLTMSVDKSMKHRYTMGGVAVRSECKDVHLDFQSGMDLHILLLNTE